MRDARGLPSEDTVQVLVDRTAPVAAIEAPADGSLFRNGVPVQLHGSATDLEDGDLGDDALSWHIVLHHGSHTHSQGDLHGADPSFTPPGDHDADSYYEIELTATDSDGVVDRKTVEIHPETIPFSLASVPAGVPLSYSGVQHVAPAKLTASIGYRTSVSAPDQFTRDGIVYTFKGWSDGGARQHPIVVPAAAATLTATYTAPPGGGGTLPSTGGQLGGLPAPTAAPRPRAEAAHRPPAPACADPERAHHRARHRAARVDRAPHAARPRAVPPLAREQRRARPPGAQLLDARVDASPGHGRGRGYLAPAPTPRRPAEARPLRGRGARDRSPRPAADRARGARTAHPLR